MGYTLFGNLTTVEEPLPPTDDPPVYYSNDRNVLLQQTNQFEQQANTTYRVAVKDSAGKQFYVELGAVFDGTTLVYRFDNDENMAALPCPPYNDKPAGVYTEV